MLDGCRRPSSDYQAIAARQRSQTIRLLHSHAKYHAIAVAYGSLEEAVRLSVKTTLKIRSAPQRYLLYSGLKRFSAGMRSSMWS